MFTKKFVKLISRKIRNKMTCFYIECAFCVHMMFSSAVVAKKKKSRSGQCPSKYFLREFETCFPSCLLKTNFQYLYIYLGIYILYKIIIFFFRKPSFKYSSWCLQKRNEFTWTITQFSESTINSMRNSCQPFKNWIKYVCRRNLNRKIVVYNL